jgi:hypothetical protein
MHVAPQSGGLRHLHIIHTGLGGGGTFTIDRSFTFTRIDSLVLRFCFLPRTAEVVIVRAKYGPAAPIDDRPKPQMREGYILVKVIAAALNPADNVYMDYGITEAGNLLGYDYAGVIEEVRPGMKRDFKKGDRICGVVKPIKGASISSSTSLLTDAPMGATHRNQRMGRLPNTLWSRRTSRCTSLTT